MIAGVSHCLLYLIFSWLVSWLTLLARASRARVEHDRGRGLVRGELQGNPEPVAIGQLHVKQHNVGHDAPVARRALAPSAASPTTSNPSATSSRRANVRNDVWSSTISTPARTSPILPVAGPGRYRGNPARRRGVPRSGSPHPTIRPARRLVNGLPRNGAPER
jgi:hypothetical protein